MIVRHRLMLSSTLVLALLVWCTLPACSAARAADDTGPPFVSGERLRAHVEFLANDLLEGREAGTRGYDLAALYVATQLELWGLEPAGDASSFLQRVPLRRATLVDSRVELTLRGQAPVTLDVPDDIIVSANVSGAAHSASADVVFAGFGITAPELQHDDYAGLDVAGKLVLVMTNAPASFPSEERAHFGSSELKAKLAADRGAVGLLQMLGPEERARYSWDRLKDLAGEPTVTWVAEDGSAGKGEPRLQARGFLGQDLTKQLFGAAGVPLADVLAAAGKGAPKPRRLPAHFSIRTTSRTEDIASSNVVGKVPGSDPALAETSVVLTAHLDHTGVGQPHDGDAIYNGAYDNAMGSAILLELARVFATAPERPRRSLLFVFVTAEEEGLLGSDYFAHHPPPAAGRAVADINLDMPLFLTAASDVTAFGAENSTLEGVVRDAVARAGLTLSPDPLPEENLFVRSDQYSFVKQGVPALYLIPGFTAVDPDVKGGEVVRTFLRHHYHQPSDDLSRPMDLDAAERFTRANYFIVEAIANDPVAPAWKPGNFFGRMFGTR